MTSNWTARILAGLVAVAIVVLGITLLTGGDDDGANPGDAEQTVADSGTTDGNTAGEGATGGDAANGNKADKRQDAAPKAEEEARRLQEERAAASEMTDDEKDAQVRAQRFYDILGSEDGDKNSAKFDSAGFCDLMSEQAREQTIDYAKRSSGIDQEWNCENSVELLVIRAKRTGGFKQTRKAKIVGVNAEGDSATATVRFGKGPLSSIPLIKEDGEWKLGASSTGESSEN